MTVVQYRDPEPRAWVGLLPSAAELARVVAATEFVPKSLRNNPAAITAAILHGDEVGLGPMQSLARMRIIDGTPTLAAETMRALVLAHGHALWSDDLTNTRVTLCGQRRGEDRVTRVTWTLDDAKRANLAGKQNWRTYPRQMLVARATAELCRLLFADVIGGLYASEEMDDGGDTPDLVGEVGVGGTEPAPKPTKPTRRRKRADVPAPTPTTPTLAVVAAPDSPTPELPALPGEDTPPPITDRQMKRQHALYNELGVTDRDERIAATSTVIGRAVRTTNDLTVDEASKLIDHLEHLVVGPPREPDE